MIELTEFKKSLIKNEIQHNSSSFYLIIIEKKDYEFHFINYKPKHPQFYIVFDKQKYVDFVINLNKIFIDENICIYNIYHNNNLTSIIKFKKI